MVIKKVHVNLNSNITGAQALFIVKCHIIALMKSIKCTVYVHLSQSSFPGETWITENILFWSLIIEKKINDIPEKGLYLEIECTVPTHHMKWHPKDQNNYQKDLLQLQNAFINARLSLSSLLGVQTFDI